MIGLNERENMNKNKLTDWDKYYQNPSSTSILTRKITEIKILNILKKIKAKDETIHICELGGANSCFYEAIIKNFPNCRYTIIDNNQLGIDLFNKKTNGRKLSNSILLDVKKATLPILNADIVFSVGLIEHFSPTITSLIIKKHFELAKENGHILITFPTKTWLYKLTRFVITILGKWIFYDERPLSMTEVEKNISRHGIIKIKEINWLIFLTQGIIYAIKN